LQEILESEDKAITKKLMVEYSQQVSKE